VVSCGGGTRPRRDVMLRPFDGFFPQALYKPGARRDKQLSGDPKTGSLRKVVDPSLSAARLPLAP